MQQKKTSSRHGARDMDMKPKTAFALTNSCGWDYMHKTCTKAQQTVQKRRQKIIRARGDGRHPGNKAF
ncbi:hypothetical protein ACRRTK_002034 [Alexandromys fortis]